MSDKTSTQGERIRLLFEDVDGDVVIIAPFIKVDALHSLLSVIPSDSHLRCITRWIPREIAAGVSDLQIFEVLVRRGNASVLLVDNLHAKMYIAGSKCLVGSANLTLAGLGERGQHSNIEVLVETDICDPGIVSTLNEIASVQRVATKEIAESAQLLADIIAEHCDSDSQVSLAWMPGSKIPQHAFRLYSVPPMGFIGKAERALLIDLAVFQPGLDEHEFRQAVRSALSSIPMVGQFLESSMDISLSLSDTYSVLQKDVGEQFSVEDRWHSFVQWMAYFFPDRVMIQERTELTLRRAQRVS